MVENGTEGQFCPECGAGTVSQSDEGMVIRVSKYYPYGECETCKLRMVERARESGAAEAMRREKLVMDIILKGLQPDEKANHGV